MEKYDTVTFDRPEAFLHRVQWGPFVLQRETERDIALTNIFQTYDLEKKHRSYKISLDGLLQSDKMENFNGNLNIFGLVQSLSKNFLVSFKLFFDCDRLRSASCENVQEVLINSDKLRFDFEDKIKNINENHETEKNDLSNCHEDAIKELNKIHRLDKKYQEAIYKLNIEKLKSELIIEHNNKLVEELRKICSI